MRAISEINPTGNLRDYLVNQGLDETEIYAQGEKSASELPYDFISILVNGPIKGESVQGGIRTCKIALSVYVKLDDGKVNTTRNKFLLGKIEDIFGSAVNYHDYQYTPDFLNLITDAKNIVTGYSTKTFNINAKIL